MSTTIRKRLTGVHYHPSFQLHKMGHDHPESPSRTRVVRNSLLKKVRDGLDWNESPARATREQLVRFHTPRHLDRMDTLFANAQQRKPKMLQVDEDTFVMANTEEAAFRSAGAVCEAVEDILTGKHKNAFCVIRPPGHHAEPDQAGGFCFFNNVGVGCLHARAISSHVRRIAVVDFDVHHGNGTEKGFAEDEDLLFISSHQGEQLFYPYTGKASTTGKHNNIMNLPFEEGQGSSEFRDYYENRVFPRIRSFNPDLIFISAGFDAHKLDPLADIQLLDDDYEWVTEKLVAIADQHCQGRLVSCLEGGYSLVALANASVRHVQALTSAPDTNDTVDLVTSPEALLRPRDDGLGELQQRLETVNIGTATEDPAQGHDGTRSGEEACRPSTKNDHVPPANEHAAQANDRVSTENERA